MNKYSKVNFNIFASMICISFFRVILYSPEKLKHPFSITLFEDWMYWTDWDRNAIFKANKFDGSKSDAVTSEDLV